MPNLFKHIKSEGGAVAIVALVVVVILGALGATLVKQSSTGSKVSGNYSDGIAAQYLAEAGIEHARAEIASQNYPATVVLTNLTNKTIQDSAGTYNVTITKSNNVYTITSTGTVNKAKRQVVKTLDHKQYKFAVYGGTNQGDNILANLFSVVLNRGVSIYPSANITGDVGCNTNIDYGAYVVTSLFFGEIKIGGDVVTHGNVVTWPSFGGVNVSGKTIERSRITRTIPGVVFPIDASSHTALSSVKTTATVGWPIALPLFDEYTLNNTTYYHNGSLTLDRRLDFLGDDRITGNGTILVKGNLTLKGDKIAGLHGSHIDDNVTFIVDGDVTLEPGAAMGGEVLIMATGDIWVGNGINYPALNIESFPAFIHNGVLLANGNIFINNMGDTGIGGAMNGCAVSQQTVTVYGNASIVYDDNVMTRIKARGLMPELPQ